MTQKEQNTIIGMIEELTVWEARVREWRGELTAILQKEEAPRRKRTKAEEAQQKIIDGYIGRRARRLARERKQFTL